MSASLLHSLFQYKAWANAQLLAALAQIDEQVHAEPRHAALRVLNHTYVVDRIFTGHLLGQPHGYAATNTTETPTLDALQQAIAASDGWYVDYVAALPAERYRDAIAFTFTDGLPGRMTREEILAHVVTHGGYHRGAASRLVNKLVDLPRDLYTGFLHQSEPERRVV